MTIKDPARLGEYTITIGYENVTVNEPSGSSVTFGGQQGLTQAIDHIVRKRVAQEDREVTLEEFVRYNDSMRTEIYSAFNSVMTPVEELQLEEMPS